MASSQQTAIGNDFYVIQVNHQGDCRDATVYAPNTTPDQPNTLPGLTYVNQAILIPANQAYRPPVPRPARPYQGAVTAVVEQQDTASRQPGLTDQGQYHVRFGFDNGNTAAGQASAPLRLNQPGTGPGIGFHFPLAQGTNVVCLGEDGDLDRASLLGTLHTDNTPTPVTANNATELRIQTRQQQLLAFNDDPHQPTILLATPQTEQHVSMQATAGQVQTTLATQRGDMDFYALQDAVTTVGQDYTQQIGGDHRIVVQNDHALTTGSRLSTDIQQTAQIKSQQALFSAGQDLRWHSGQHFIAQTGPLSAMSTEGPLVLQAQQLLVQGQQGAHVLGSGKAP
ncbi:MAG: hypothetical protein HWD59_15075 [Coxiellaceae bacterium]|nr:MAG: hypothetical protein HWD59_15075 [Coxiellaceae bacterium]